MPATSATGACLCGAVQFEIQMPSNWVAHCHCSICRRAHGAAYVTWVSVPVAQFRITAGEEQLSSYRATEAATRRFCRSCGSQMFFQSPRWAGEIHVTRASIAGEVDRAPQVHAFYSDRAEWVSVDGETPRRGGKTGVEPL